MEKVLIKCSSNLDLPFSNVPQKCVKTVENLTVYITPNQYQMTDKKA
jgi:hypothetical protein